MLELNARGPYASKDQAKANEANKFIGVGAYGSSTYAYARSIDPAVVNCGAYVETDRVFVSVNGARRVRIGINAILLELRLATEAKAVILADGPQDRNRPYNIGERELAEFLLSRGYEPWFHPAGFDEWRFRPLC